MAVFSLASAQNFRPYQDVVPASAVTSTGLFKVHQIGTQVLFEVPSSLLGRDLIWYVERGSVSTNVAEGAGKSAPEGAGLTPNNLMIRLERRGDTMIVRNYTDVLSRRSGDLPLGPGGPSSDQKVSPMARAVSESALATPLAILPIATINANGDPVFNATELFRLGVPELELSSVFGSARIDPGRSYIENLRAFPRNVMVDAFVTAATPDGKGSVAAILKHSWTLLPDVPMKTREYDQRIGLFAIEFSEFSANSNTGEVSKSFIRRYRLEKKDPNAAVSEPVKPIVYYIGRTVPEKWRKYVRQGIEDWQPAFEAAGFKNAIIAKDAPTEAEDPTWDPSDTRHSVIRWIANPVVNAMGPQIPDPRTGEILSSHILIWEDVLKLANAWYYGMCSAVDTRAQTLPLSDELTGRMMRYIVAHEVGHSIGLRHNHRASTAFTVAQLRDPAFCKEFGSTASIMAYGRMNYVAQPGDGVDPESLMPKVGLYDFHAIKWAYAPLPADKEKEILNEWAGMSLQDPRLAFGGEDLGAYVDPRVQTQNIGTERVEATQLGLANLKIAVANLLPAYRANAKDFGSLYDRWAEMLNIRHDYLSSVAKEIGGREETRTDTSFEPQFKPVPAERQRSATKFLLDEGLHWDPVYYSSGILPNAMPVNASNPLRLYQSALMVQFFDPMRLGNVSDSQMDEGDEAVYTIDEYLGDVVDGIFSEATAKSHPSLLRRALHRDFFTLVERLYMVTPTAESEGLRLEGAPSYMVEAFSSSLGTDSRAAMRVALQALEKRLDEAKSSAKDPLVAAHWADCLSATRRLLAR